MNNYNDNGELINSVSWLHRGGWEKAHIDMVVTTQEGKEKSSHGHSPTRWNSIVPKEPTGAILVGLKKDSGKFSSNLPAPYGPIK